MEEEEEEEEDDDEGNEQNEEEEEQDEETVQVSRASSNVVLLSDPRDISEGLVNPAFCQDDCQQSSQSRPSSQCGRRVKSPRWACLSRDRPYGHCRSLSSSVENMTFSGAPLSPMRGSFPSLNDPMNKESLSDGRSFRDDTSLHCSRSRGTVVVCDS